MATAGYVTSSRVGHPERFARDDEAIAQVKAQGDRDFDAFFSLMDKAISGEPYFLSQLPTCLDHYVAMLAEWSSDRDGLLAKMPKLRALCDAFRQDAAYAAALGAHAMPGRNAVE
jgi:glutathione S-transferase